jgi:hypothetical protein
LGHGNLYEYPDMKLKEMETEQIILPI